MPGSTDVDGGRVLGAPGVTTGAVLDGRSRGSVLLRRVLAGTPAGESPLTHAELVPAREGVTQGWPDWVPEDVRAPFLARGIARPWSHQAAAADRAHAGEHVVVATGTASGKSLAYQLPVLTRLNADPRATALYLSPTKALGADQLRTVADLRVDGVRAASYDGDTPLPERDWVRQHANWVFTNPDMLHRGILPRHGRWTTFLRRLRYVVIDECHTYRGLFGSHVALLMRRLRRVCARYGAHPTFVLASATVSEPAVSASVLTGLDVAEVTDDGSPRGARAVALWEPPLLEEVTGENGAPVRRSAGAETARMLADLVVEGARSLAFVRSRRGAELTALGARRVLAEIDEELGVAGGGVPGGLPARGAPGAGAGAAERVVARGGDDERPRARGGHRRARRRGGRRVPGHAGVVLAAGGTRGAVGRRRARGARRPRRPPRHLPRAPPGGDARRAPGALRARPHQPLRARPAPGLRGVGDPVDAGRRGVAGW